MLFNQMVLEEEEELKRREKELEKWLEKAPSGKLNVYKRGSKWRWYLRIIKNNQAVRICADNMDKKLLKQLAEKEANRRELQDTRQQIEAIERYKTAYYQNHQEGKFMLRSRRERLETDSPGMWTLLHDNELDKWKEESFQQLTIHSEQKKFTSKQGLLTRSKSEAIIATVLEDMEVPFHYEEKLVLEGTSIYPDFTLRHPFTGRVVYWEHFGMMEEETYQADTIRKLNNYIKNGNIPGVDLICSFETRNEPMSFKKAKAHVEYFIDNMQ